MFSPQILEFFSLLKKHNISFSLGGSGMLVALGLLPASERNDWDILSDCPMDQILPLLTDSKHIQPQKPFASEYLLKFEHLGEKIDWIGKFAIYDQNNHLHQFTSMPHSYHLGVPLSDPKDWLKVYELLNRKDKVEILKSYLHRLKDS
jgi:hypothetical protein